MKHPTSCIVCINCQILTTSRQATGSSRLTQISLPWQQGSAHNILHGSVESAIPENPLVGPNISGLSAIQADLQAILCKFWGVNFGRQGPKSKIEERFIVCHGGLMAKKWLDSIEKQKRRSNVCDKQTDTQSHRQKNNRLLGQARRSINSVDNVDSALTHWCSLKTGNMLIFREYIYFKKL